VVRVVNVAASTCAVQCSHFGIRRCENIGCWWCWSDNARVHAEQLDWRRDVAALRKFGDVFGADTLVVVRVSTTLLQHAARRRLTPADVASLLCRMGGLDEPAVVETLLVRARQRTAALSLSLSSSSTSTSPVLSTSVTTTITHESATRVIATTALDDEAFFAAFEQLLEERLEGLYERAQVLGL
jgi:hypothetical protein